MCRIGEGTVIFVFVVEFSLLGYMLILEGQIDLMIALICWGYEVVSDRVKYELWLIFNISPAEFLLISCCCGHYANVGCML